MYSVIQALSSLNYSYFDLSFYAEPKKKKKKISLKQSYAGVSHLEKHEL